MTFFMLHFFALKIPGSAGIWGKVMTFGQLADRTGNRVDIAHNAFAVEGVQVVKFQVTFIVPVQS